MIFANIERRCPRLFVDCDTTHFALLSYIFYPWYIVIFWLLEMYRAFAVN